MSTEILPLAALEDPVTERANPRNRRGSGTVFVAVDAPVLARGAEIVDMPGTGPVYEHNTIEGEAALAALTSRGDPGFAAFAADFCALAYGRAAAAGTHGARARSGSSGLGRLR